MSLRYLICLAGLMAVALGLFLIRLWQPEQQVRKHSAHLLEAVAHKDWPGVAGFIGADYRDQWGNDRAAVSDRTREVFRYLHQVRISAIDPNVRLENRIGYWRANIIIEGAEDSDLMAAVKARINTLQAPFELEWHQVSGKPWDWKLVAVRNPELTVSSEY
jgi:hypothetical protein